VWSSRAPLDGQSGKLKLLMGLEAMPADDVAD
jgi:hypothetical protein